MSRILSWLRMAPHPDRIDNLHSLPAGSGPPVPIAEVAATTEQANQNKQTKQANQTLQADAGDQSVSVSGISASLSASCGTLRDHVDMNLGLTEKIREVSVDVETRALSAQSRIEKLTDSSAEIAAIAQTISEIAGQTKLLAINARIESARAGDAGRGFAVVASEVGELAARANESTLRISAMAAEIDSETMAASETMSGLVETVSEDIKVSVSELVDGLQDTAEEVNMIADRALSLAGGDVESCEPADSIDRQSQLLNNRP